MNDNEKRKESRCEICLNKEDCKSADLRDLGESCLGFKPFSSKYALMETAAQMSSDDYKERFKAEYTQLKIRYDALHRMLVKADAGTLEFKPSCPISLLRKQKAQMGQYLYCLEVRAQIENIKL